jgi:hypothetical protein
MEYYNNTTLCITGSELIRPEILSEGYYKKLRAEDRINVLRRGCKNTPALIEFQSLPEKYKQAVIKLYGDPYKTVKYNQFKDHIEPDENARDFFNKYQHSNGEYLSDQKKLEYYTNAIILNAVIKVSKERKSYRKARGGSSFNILENIFESINRLDRNQYPHSLKLSDRFRKTLAKYKKEGYQSLVSGKFGNKNSEKVNDNAKIWLLGQWVNMVEVVPGAQQLLSIYNKKAETEGWKKIKNVGTIDNFLEETKEMWYGHRYGELKSKEKYTLQHSTILPTMRDSLWYSDGTKLNYYYQDENGKVCTCQVYEVMDVFSENLLGYCISTAEDFQAQYKAFKMAIQTSGQKPYEMKYDNQGGHKKLETADFLKKLAHLSIRTAPYNGRSKTIENAFYRFQSQFLKKDWFFTGQNITAKKDESRENLERIITNKSNLPTLQEIHNIYAKRREEWKNAPHFATGIGKVEMYYKSENPKATKVQMWDMVDMFWITRDKPVTCGGWGISFTEKNEKYEYLVYDKNRMPDIEWLRKNIDKKFYIKFDPEDMSLVYLYEKDATGLRFVTSAETKINIHRGKQEQEDWEAAYIKYIEEENKRLRIQNRDNMNAILEMNNLLPEQHGLISPRIKGIETSKRKKAKKTMDVAQVQKEVSNSVALDENDYDESEIYDLY